MQFLMDLTELAEDVMMVLTMNIMEIIIIMIKSIQNFTFEHMFGNGNDT